MNARRLRGPDAADLLPAVERLVPIPRVHFEADATARVLRGEVPPEPEMSPYRRGPIGPARAR